jgi:SHS2 domain-containing protein
MNRALLKAVEQNMYFQENAPAPGQENLRKEIKATLYNELEIKYGSGFAQWVIDRIGQQKQ